MDEPSRTVRKRIVNTLSPAYAKSAVQQNVLDIISIATVIVSSEDPAYPVDNIFDMSQGNTVQRWIAADEGEQCIILDFDTPQKIQRIDLAIHEFACQRTQELTISYSTDRGKTYQELVRQEYNFSPPGTSCEKESWSFALDPVSYLRLYINPDKSGKPCRATVSSLILY